MRKEETRGSGRAEMIRMARESCAMQMVPSGAEGRPYDRAYTPERLKKRSYIRQDEKGNSIGNELASRLPMIRFVCAIIILLGIIAADQLKLEYDGMQTVQLQEYISSNKAIDQAEEFFSTLTKDKIVEVFNRLN